MDELFLSLERLISPLSYDFLDSDLAELAKQELLDIIGRPKWVEELVTASIKLIALNVSFYLGVGSGIILTLSSCPRRNIPVSHPSFAS